jgi:hypothetical protein
VGEPDDQDSGKLRAERLRQRIEELRRRTPAPSRPLSPREFTDDAAGEENRGKATDEES